MKGFRILKAADLPFEVIILLTAGLIALIAGYLLFPVSMGILPYYENGLYGLFLVLFALQAIVLGKTPFGNAKRSKPLISAGFAVAIFGVVTAMIPGIFKSLPRIMLFACFGIGGLCLLLQLFISRNRLRAWIRYGGIFYHLSAGCIAVYLLSIITGVIVLLHRLLSVQMTAVTAIIYGLAVLYLSAVLKRIYLKYPEDTKTKKGDEGLPIDSAMIMLMSFFMIVLGLLLIPVSMGILPFSPSAQLGLLMFLFAVQMLALGSTPVGPFPRTWLMVLLGLLFASAGIVSCIIPGILVLQLTILVGVLNILGGIIAVAKVTAPLLKKRDKPADSVPAILIRLSATQLALGLLSILFGTSMLVSNMIPGMIIGIILASNGFVLLYLLRVLSGIDRIRAEMEAEKT